MPARPDADRAARAAAGARRTPRRDTTAPRAESGPHRGTYDGRLPAFNGANGIRLDAFGVLTLSNTIWDNVAAGVDVSRGTGNTILTNAITADGGIGIDLEPVGVTGNDMFDPDPGPNDLVNYPFVTSAVSTATGTTVAWQIIKGLPSTDFLLEFFASDDDRGRRLDLRALALRHHLLSGPKPRRASWPGGSRLRGA